MDTAGPLSCALAALLWSSAALADPPPPPKVAPATEAPSRTGYEQSLPPAVDDGSIQRRVAVATGTVGLAGWGVGGVFGILALSRWNDVKSAASSCRDPVHFTGCPKAVKTDQAAASSYATVSTYGFIAGGAALAGAAAMWFFAPRSPRAGQEGAIQLVPMVSVGPGGAAGFIKVVF